MARGAILAGACLIFLASAAGCAWLGMGLSRALPDGGAECPGRLISTQEIEGDFRSRQRVRVQAEGLDWRLELVAQKRGEVLVLIGLEAFGAKSFVVTQRGARVEVERPRGALPMPPINLLRDFHRARLASEDAPPEPGVTIERPSQGEVRIEHRSCGYRTQLVLLEDAPLPPRGETAR